MNDAKRLKGGDVTGMAEQNDKDAHLLPMLRLYALTFYNGVGDDPHLVATDIAGEALMALSRGIFRETVKGTDVGRIRDVAPAVIATVLDTLVLRTLTDQQVWRAEALRILRIVVDHFEAEGRQPDPSEDDPIED